ncbi:acetate--CoA ligase family protein [Caldovatus aquaticus]|uniref:Acetate--CoA ligase family protein n=1 Tax=Caldovatus aquaticus TaxID=2865671 RepID=A0ABS7F5Y6_9PROT|nr:acetate--CoA ligase family protein [Caldovatus aquaticus]MBW8271032.1 acetate--CoA ligase family protein [Caldovatus aquaticus]
MGGLSASGAGAGADDAASRRPRPEEEEAARGLDALFRPRSVAIVGASTDPRKLGGRPLANMLRAGFRGRLYPVHPSAREVQGLPAFPGIEDIPEPVEQAIIAVPAAAAPAALDAAIRKGVGVVVMFSSGFGELGAEGRAVQEAMAARCRAAGVRLLGPNCLGVMNPADGVFATFSSSLTGSRAWPRPGRIGIATQSGAVGTYCLTLLADRGAGISHYVATGNEADVDVAACIAWLAEDAATGVILTCLEGCRDGARLRRALALCAARGKPVVAMKVGVSEAGAAATLSHTGTLAGSDAGYQAAFEEAGAWRARSLEEAADVAAACTAGPLPRGRRLGVVTVSGGAGALLADEAAARGLELPQIPEEAQRAILALVPFASPRNPVDATAQTGNDRTLLTRMMAIMLGEQGARARFDVVVAFLAFVAENAEAFATVLPALETLRGEHPRTAFLLAMRGTPEQRRMLLEKGFFLCEDPSEALRAAAALVHFGTRLPQPAPAPPPAVAPRRLPEGPLDEAAARRLLAEAGVPFVAARIARGAAEAAEAAAALGFPVALKVLSPDLAHKSDVGGVRLGLRDAREVAAAYEAMLGAVRAAAPQARIEGALVSPMLQGGVETVLGVHRDPVFGPVAMFGLGGVFVEVFRDVAFRLAPLSRAQALAQIDSIRGRALLEGARGRPAVDKGAIADALVALTRFALAHPEVASVEINPFLALPEGGLGLDAVVLRSG